MTNLKSAAELHQINNLLKGELEFIKYEIRFYKSAIENSSKTLNSGQAIKSIEAYATDLDKKEESVEKFKVLLKAHESKLAELVQNDITGMGISKDHEHIQNHIHTLSREFTEIKKQILRSLQNKM